MADQQEPENVSVNLQFTEATTQHLQEAIDKAIEAGEPVSVAVTMSRTALETFQSQVTQGVSVAHVIVHHPDEVEEEPESEPLPEEDEDVEEEPA